MLKPRELWPDKFSNTKVLASFDYDWERFCAGCFERGLVRRLSPDELLFDSAGQRLGSGYLGVGAGKQVEVPWSDTPVEVLRSVFNLPPSDELQHQIEGDVTALPHHGNWQGLVLNEPLILHWISDDVAASLFLFRLPPPWAPVFALDRPAPGWTVGSDKEEEIIGLTIIPPGWLSPIG